MAAVVLRAWHESARFQADAVQAMIHARKERVRAAVLGAWRAVAVELVRAAANGNFHIIALPLMVSVHPDRSPAGLHLPVA